MDEGANVALHAAQTLDDSDLSLSYGNQKKTNTQTSTDISHTASNVGSLNGKVNIKAGQDYTQTGSNVLTPQGDINIAAQEVLINEVQNTGNARQETKFEKSGLTLALSSSVLDAVNAVESLRKASNQTKSSRMKNLATASAALTIANAAQAATVAKGFDKAGGSISLSIGGNTSESQSTQTYSTAQGSNVTAGGNKTSSLHHPLPSRERAGVRGQKKKATSPSRAAT